MNSYNFLSAAIELLVVFVFAMGALALLKLLFS